jgi:hypothetical protein
MAKGDLGEYYSILGTAQQTRFSAQKKELEEERKRARRDRYLGYIAKPILGAIGEEVVDLVTSPFEEKYKDFSNNVGVMQAKAKQRAADRQSEADFTKRKKALAYSGVFGEGADGFYDEAGFDAAKAAYVAADPDNAAKIESGLYTGYLKEEGKKRGATIRARDEARLKLADAYKSSGTVEDNYINQRSKGVAGAFGDVLQGDNVEKQDARAREIYEKSLQSKSMDAYLNFDQSIKNGSTPVEAAKKAEELILPETAYDKDFVITTTTIEVDVDGKRTAVTYKSTYNRTSENYKQNKGFTKQEKISEEVLTPELEAQAQKDLVLEANREFNYTSQARGLFTDKAFREFNQKAKDEGIDITNINTVSERLKVAEIFNEYDKDENMAKTEKARVYAETQRISTVSRMLETDTLYRTALKNYTDDPTNNDLKNEYYKHHNRLMEAYEAIKAGKMPISAGPVVLVDPNVDPTTTTTGGGSSIPGRVSIPSTPGATVPPAGTTPPEEGDKRINSKGEPIIYKNGKWVANDGSI